MDPRPLMYGESCELYRFCQLKWSMFLVKLNIDDRYDESEKRSEVKEQQWCRYLHIPQRFYLSGRFFSPFPFWWFLSHRTFFFMEVWVILLHEDSTRAKHIPCLSSMRFSPLHVVLSRGLPWRIVISLMLHFKPTQISIVISFIFAVLKKNCRAKHLVNNYGKYCNSRWKWEEIAVVAVSEGMNLRI